jgi:hypothetical protein
MFSKDRKFFFPFIFPSVSPLPRYLGVLFPLEKKIFIFQKSFNTQGIRCWLPVLWFFSLNHHRYSPKYKKRISLNI